MDEDILLLYYYDDGLSEEERREIEAALEADASLREAYRRLSRELDRLKEREPVAVAAETTARWHDTIDRAARQEVARTKASRSVVHLPSFAWGAIAAAALVIGIGIGSMLSDRAPLQPPPGDPPQVAATVDDGMPSSAFARGLSVHLRRSREDLTELSFNGDSERTMLIMHILQQNRLFERAAEQNDSDDLARVLRAFEPILIRLAADDISPEDARALQAQLAFELNVMLTKLDRDVSETSGPI